MYCMKCGTETPASANFCRKCGNAIAGEGASAEVATLEPPPLRTDPPPFKPEGSTRSPQSGGTGAARWAGFWRRYAASFIDGIVLTIPAVLLGVAIGTGLFSSAEPDDTVAIVALYAASWVLNWLYFAYFHSAEWQATPGKRLFGIKVVGMSGERIGFGRASGRWLAIMLSGITLGIGFLMAAFTRQKRGLHDFMAGTVVVSANTTSADLAQGMAPPKLTGGVLTTILLLGILPVIGILAATAIPAYHGYRIRAQVSSGIMEAAPYKVAVASQIAAGAELDAIDSAAVGVAETPESHYLSAVEVMGGVIVLTYGQQANAALQDKTVVLHPNTDSDGNVVWVCGLAPLPEGVSPLWEDEDFQQYTDVEAKYLPAACRE
jgi:uncharacterized RDD family membrane protein YckC/Tfp pilus assembly major pilin PilA